MPKWKPINNLFLYLPLALLSLAPSAFSQALGISCGNFTNAPQVGVSSSQVCIASGGTQPYQWFVNFGTLPPGWALQASGNTAVIGGLATQPGTFAYGILLTDHVGASAPYSIGVFVQPSVPLRITTPNPLPAARVGTPYSVALTSIGGVGPFTWAPYQFPPQFALSPSGILTGNPATPGSYSLNVSVTDQGLGNGVGQAFSLTVLPALLNMSCSPTSGPIEAGLPYSTFCTATGGGGSFAWTINGALPPGIALSPSGASATISGTPSSPGSYSYSVQVTDANQFQTQSQTQAFSGTIASTPDFSVTALPHALIGTAYTGNLVAVGGIGPYSWTTVSGGVPGLTLNADGTLTGKPTQAGTFAVTVKVIDKNGISSPNRTLTVIVDLLSQSINFPGIPNNLLGTSPLSISATASSGLSVIFRSNNTSVCTVSGSTVTLVSAGLCSITATQDGNPSYAAATPVTQTFTITNPLSAQSIFFGPLTTRTFGEPPFPVAASATSGLPVSFSSNSPSTCIVSGNVVTLLAAGSCSITATQSGSSAYSAAIPVTQIFTISPPLTSQTISFTTIGTHLFGDAPFQLVAFATSGLPVVVTSNTPSLCVVSQTTVTIIGAGSCSLTATQSGNSTFAAASTSQTFVVAKANQSITFAAIAPHLITDPPFDLQASSSSGLPVLLTLLSGPASLNWLTLTLAGATGTVTVQATQAGSANFNAAPAVTRTFDVNSPLPVISVVTNGASFKLLPLAPASYAAAFGVNFAAKPGDPPTTITLIDSAGSQTTATIVYAGDTQLNFLVPPGIATGPASLTVKNRAGTSLPYPLSVSSISPGLFTQDAAGLLPAAQVLTISTDGSRAIQPVGICGAAQNCIYLPISFVPGTSVYLLLYGTGIRGRSSLDAVSATIDGLSNSVLFAGPQGDFPGLDQINLQLPNTLAGRGGVDLTLTVDGVQANVVHLVIN